MKEVLQIAYLRHLQDFYLFESVKDGSIMDTDYFCERRCSTPVPGPFERKEHSYVVWEE